MKYTLTSKISLLILGFAAHLSGCAADGYETWKTEISCDQQHFTLTSYCKPSNEPETMNTCKDEQVLTKDGLKSVSIPLAETKSINKELRATHWKCQQVGDTSYLEIRYAAGLGNIPNNEAVEFFDLQLRTISNEATQLKILQTGKKTNKGRVKSLMPE